MNPGIIDAFPDQSQRTEVLRAGFREVRSRVGFNAGGGRQLATEVFIDALQHDKAKLKLFLQDILAASRAESMPLLVALDTVNWAAARQDLWLKGRATRPRSMRTRSEVDNARARGDPPGAPRHAAPPPPGGAGHVHHPKFASKRFFPRASVAASPWRSWS